MRKPDSLKKVKHIHFTGVKGVGMTALACCAQDLGIRVTGSDVSETFVTDQVLEKRGIAWKVGFSPENVGSPGLLVTTAAHGGFENPEVRGAIRKGIRVVSYAEGLAMFAEGKETISVCGVGGKTTTSSLIATAFDFLGFKPSFAIGVASINPLGDPGKMADGKYFIAEADEYAVSPGIDNQPKFSFQKPRIIVVTNIEHDHPDIYPRLSDVKKAFHQFFQKLPQDGFLLACVDNPNVAGLIKSGLDVPVQTYGFSPRADWRIGRISFAPGKTFFDLSYQGIDFGKIVLSVPGRFNALNATAALAVVNFLGGDVRKTIAALAEFRGTQRRFELIGERKGVSFYDDYAHHPMEIKATLKAARDWFPDRRVVVVFQPHTFTRTQVLFKDFSQSFEEADRVVICDIYASAREKPITGVSSKALAMATKKYKRNTFYCSGKKEVLGHLSESACEGDIVLTLGAGDIFLWRKDILKVLRSI